MVVSMLGVKLYFDLCYITLSIAEAVLFFFFFFINLGVTHGIIALSPCTQRVEFFFFFFNRRIIALQNFAFFVKPQHVSAIGIHLSHPF